jgi:hypothetical protein
MARPRKKNPTAEEELRRNSLHPERLTVEQEVRVLYRWASRRRFTTVMDALSRILGKMDIPPDRARLPRRGFDEP